MWFDDLKRMKKEKEQDKVNDAQEKLHYARTDNSNMNSDSSRGRGCGSYSRGRGRGRGHGRGRGNNQNQGQRDSLKNYEDNKQKGKEHEQRDLSHIKCYRYDKFGHFVQDAQIENKTMSQTLLRH
nr:uncharacterized protein [Tanacetum cinerariifolium]GEY06868.1 uncharacterized protein [Tanacetum cinerariifolium]